MSELTAVVIPLLAVAGALYLVGIIGVFRSGRRQRKRQNLYGLTYTAGLAIAAVACMIGAWK